MSNEQFQSLARERDARIGIILTRIVELEWNQVLREMDGLDVDSGDVAKAATLLGKFQILDKLMEALSEGSLGSDYEIEAEWRRELVERVVEAFKLNERTPSPPRRYRGLAQQVADACGLEVIEE